MTGRVAHLWIDNELSHNQPTFKYSFPRSERFKLQSIYWPEKIEEVQRRENEDEKIHSQALKISKLIDEEERIGRGNMLKNNKAMRARTTHLQKRQYRTALGTPERSRNSITRVDSKVVERLFVKCPKGESPKNRDKFGFLNWEIIPTEVLSTQAFNPEKTTEDWAKTTAHSKSPSKNPPPSRHFSRGKRIDLARPQNFYPGPGTYKIQRYLDRLIARRPLQH